MLHTWGEAGYWAWASTLATFETMVAHCRSAEKSQVESYCGRQCYWDWDLAEGGCHSGRLEGSLVRMWGACVLLINEPGGALVSLPGVIGSLFVHKGTFGGCG